LPSLDPDEALKVAIVAAVCAGDTKRARALLDVLDARPAATPVVALTSSQPRGDIDRRIWSRDRAGSTDPKRKMRYKG